ncbi:alpha/beta fold hydrolase [Mycobacterium sp. NPDC050551]|uniref:alpha/beta fold hydrolase n=1 Tax=Mycobacterium sp. NPDC050551 TaxID=3155407 RepID=UPI0034276FBE
MLDYRRGAYVFDLLDEGPSDGAVVVLLHGHPQTKSSWDAVIPRLTASGYRCLAPDQRGRSPASRPKRIRDYRARELVEDIRALIEHFGQRRVHVVGHDWGALVAWSVAARYPERLASLTALSGPHPSALQVAMMTSRQAFASWYAYAYLVPRFFEWWHLGSGRDGARLVRSLVAGGQSAEHAERDVRAMVAPGAYTAALNWYRAAPLAGRVGRVDVPAMYVWSDGDKYIRESAARRCGRYVTAEYRFEIHHGMSHWMPDQHPELVADLLLDWFASHPDK